MRQLYGAGFNAHGQLNEHSTTELVEADRATFELLTIAENLEVLLAKWSRTVLLQDATLTLLGYQARSGGQRTEIHLPENFVFKSSFCDDDTLQIGFIGTNGELLLLEEDDQSTPEDGQLRLVRQGNADSPRLSFVAVTETGSTCVAFLQSPASHLIHLLEFKSFSDFLRWYDEPSESNMNSGEASSASGVHHMIQGKIRQLDAGAAYFALLTEAGDVYTWSPDSRQHRCLARAPSPEAPADKPSLVDALGGLRIDKLAVGGWMAMALSHDHDVYAWGRVKPSEKQGNMSVIPDVDEIIKLVDVREDLGVEDIAVGSDHAVLLAEDGRVFGIGDNHNGQLGIGRGHEENYIGDWTEIEDLREKKAKKVWCGHSTSFVLVESGGDSLINGNTYNLT